MLSFALRCILLRALNFQSGARSCLNPSDALPASSPGVASRLRERFWGVCGSCGLGGTWPWVGSPLHRTRSCPAARPPRKAPNSHPDHRDLAVRLRVLLWPCSIFFFFTGHLCKMHTHLLLLLLSPSSSNFRGLWVLACMACAISNSHPGETSPAAQSLSSGEPGKGSWENSRKIK